MGEERVGFPSDFVFSFFLVIIISSSVQRRKKNGQRGEGCLHSMLFTSIRSRGGEKEELQDIGI